MVCLNRPFFTDFISYSIPENFVSFLFSHGFNKWRDPIKPTAILQRLCKNYKLDGPHFTPGKCRVNKYVFCAQDHIIDDNGKNQLKGLFGNYK